MYLFIYLKSIFFKWLRKKLMKFISGKSEKANSNPLQFGSMVTVVLRERNL